ncbi:hypothetical protein LCGC14_1456650 [marine sediment metagenome]|uniref:Uncharacterized protein n=1 Tax=marine sediment metagenome TaxID=412755 RepID=A0A0F9MI84_9ZZZZ
MILKKKEHDLIFFFLLITSIVGVIIIGDLIFPVLILKHIFIVLTVSFLSTFLFYKFSFISKKRDLKFFLILTVVCWLALPWFFTLIHELSHAITSLINGFEVINIEINWPYGGETNLPPDSWVIPEVRKIGYTRVSLSGSLVSVLIISILNRGIYHIKEIRVSVFFPIFMITSWWILFEVLYWFNGITSYIKGIGMMNDAYQFLYLYLQLSDPFILIDPNLLRIIIAGIFAVLLIWFPMNLLKRIKIWGSI